MILKYRVPNEGVAAHQFKLSTMAISRIAEVLSLDRRITQMDSILVGEQKHFYSGILHVVALIARSNNIHSKTLCEMRRKVERGNRRTEELLEKPAIVRCMFE